MAAEVIMEDVMPEIKTVNGFCIVGTCVRMNLKNKRILELKIQTTTRYGDVITPSVYVYGRGECSKVMSAIRKSRSSRLRIEGYIDSGKRMVIVDGEDDFAYVERLVAVKISFCASQMELELGIPGFTKEANENKFKLYGIVYGVYTNSSKTHSVVTVYTHPSNGISFTRVLAFGRNAAYIADKLKQYDEVAVIGEIREYRPKHLEKSEDVSDQATENVDENKESEELADDSEKKAIKNEVLDSEKKAFKRVPMYAFFAVDIEKPKKQK